ncbi:MAG: YfbR-like 5'-deoxynucleotidase [Faecalibacterium prausnitzii]
MKLYPFSALLARMKYITRWSLMHSTRPESLSEHTCDTALLAHTLCLIARRYTGTPCRPKTVAVAALSITMHQRSSPAICPRRSSTAAPACGMPIRRWRPRAWIP